MNGEQDDLNYTALNPGIRETVRWLRSLGFATTSSGDGKTHDCAGCDPAYPYVTIEIDPPEQLIAVTRQVAQLLRDLDLEIGGWDVDEDDVPFLTGVNLETTFVLQMDRSYIEIQGLDDALLHERLAAATC